MWVRLELAGGYHRRTRWVERTSWSLRCVEMVAQGTRERSVGGWRRMLMIAGDSAEGRRGDTGCSQEARANSDQGETMTLQPDTWR